jgi:hypothetical protein
VARPRSNHSLRFEKILRAAAAPGVIPNISDVDFSQIADLIPWTAIMDPNGEAFTLKFVRAGEQLSNFFGRDAVGLDYLDFVDPAIKGEAFDAAFVMLSRPCGLWQITPGLTADGQSIEAEYTGYPIFDEKSGRGQIIFLIQHALERVPLIVLVQHSTEWTWLEMRGASPG